MTTESQIHQDEPEYILSINQNNAEGIPVPVAILRPDMTFEFRDGYTPEGAARIFWDAISFEGKSLIERNRELVEVVAYWMGRTEQLAESFMVADAERVSLAEEVIRLKKFRVTG